MEVKTLLCRYTYRFFRYDIPNSKTDPTRVVPGTVFLFRIRRIRHVFLRCRARSYAHASPTLVCVSRFVEHSPFNIAPTLVSWLAANGMAWPYTVACQYLVVQKFIAACCVPGISGGGGCVRSRRAMFSSWARPHTINTTPLLVAQWLQGCIYKPRR